VVEAWPNLDESARRAIVALASLTLPVPVRVTIQTILDAAGK
jgi:hypothetical protein